MVKRWTLSPIALVLVPLVLLLMIGACGGAEDTPVPAPTAAPTSTTVPATAAAATATPIPAATATPMAESTGDAKMGGELRIGMTAADIPLSDIAADQGFEGWRFVGFQLNNGLTIWDWNGEIIPGAVPGLAESWEVDPNDPKKWIFHLRDGLKFHDGNDIDADAVVASSYRMFNEEHPYYSSQVAGLTTWVWGTTCCAADAYRAIDPKTVELTTTEISGYVPFASVFTNIGSPAALEEWGTEQFPENHVGAGPFEMVEKTPRVSLTMDRFEDYWGNKPNVDRVILRPLAEPTTRLSALRADEVDWIEVPPSDAIDTLREEGYQLYTKIYPHVWPYQFNVLAPPFDNKLVRQALNYAVDRESICRDLLNGICIPSTGFAYPGHVSFGEPAETYSYDPDKARALLEESGVELPLKFKNLISTSGSGQMSPLPMNEFIQRNLKEVGVDMELVPMDWNALLSRAFFRNNGYTFTEENAELGTYNISYAFVEPGVWAKFFGTDGVINKGGYSNPDVDEYFRQAQESFDFDEQDRLIAKAHELIIEDAPYLFIVHDLNPRVLNPRVKGYIQDQSWFTNLQDLWIER